MIKGKCFKGSTLILFALLDKLGMMRPLCMIELGIHLFVLHSVIAEIPDQILQNKCTVCSWAGWNSWETCNANGAKRRMRQVYCPIDLMNTAMEDYFTRCYNESKGNLLLADFYDYAACNSTDIYDNSTEPAEMGKFDDNEDNATNHTNCTACSWVCWGPWEKCHVNGARRRRRLACCPDDLREINMEECLSRCHTEFPGQIMISDLYDYSACNAKTALRKTAHTVGKTSSMKRLTSSWLWTLLAFATSSLLYAN